MSCVEMLLLAIALAMDATAVSIGVSVGLPHVQRRQVFRFAFHFGLFQAGMPIIGWFIGSTFRPYVEAWDHWLAFGLLFGIGGKAIWDSFHDDEDSRATRDPTRGWSLVILSVATSIDALAVGMSLAVLAQAIWYPAAVIGIVTAALSVLGMALGARLGQRFGFRVRIVGGLILIGIGVKILFEGLALFG